MFCKNCGKEIAENVRFCSGCGSEVNVTAVPGNSMNTSNQVSSASPKKKSKLKIVLIIVLVIVLLIVGILIYAGTHSFLKVDDVKDGVLYGYENETIGDALERYFTDCSWESFVADTDDAIDVVEFVGYDAYGQKFKMQFIHDYDNEELESDEFVVYGCWLDGEAFSQDEQDYLIYCIYNDMDWSPSTYTYDYYG